MDKHYKSLLEKLTLLASLKSVELTPEEALLYGVEYCDNFNEFELMEGGEDEQ
ncbi:MULTISPECIES: hypothetical protein [Sphingobacterium]|uniref:Phage protein n=1 Tax=Sphingobacterium litopenaei TaxID=2763500 RepID=A0ABR7YFW2_9SPHI|nr:MULTISPECIES: hypothetical protein [Sphingobacterium]MBD1430211.1 hypothetical protein [Sphingobacterium litopenaei]NGM73486.1 hypothetical protein [Sphingobacterium sp. SGL-16]